MKKNNISSAQFTKKMRETHTIYMPQMLYYHNDLLMAAFKYGGYNLKIVPEFDTLSKYTFSTIGKDYCTCATYIVGNLLSLLEQGDVDSRRVAFLEPQTGGACRAGNYYNLIIQCLKKAGYEYVPVISLNSHGLEQHDGFKINLKMLLGAVAAVCYSDLLMTLTQQIKPYEVNKGEACELRQKWLDKLTESISTGKDIVRRRSIYKEIVEDFKKIETDKSIRKTKVGIVGEIYIKYSPIGNKHLESFLEEHNCDYRQGGFINYCIYVLYTEMKNLELNNKNSAVLLGYKKLIDYLCKMQKEINDIIEDGGFLHDGSFYELHSYVKDIISEYYNIGDGWLIAGEAVDLIKQGYDRVLVVHPFGCLVSHVGERGIIKPIEQMYPGANLTSIEYDYEQSETLRESRIMLAIS